jgi:5-methylcytosine-specific restriction endonuclease McrA
MNAISRPRRANEAVVSAIVYRGHRCSDRYAFNVESLFEFLADLGWDYKTIGTAIAWLLNSGQICWSQTRQSVCYLSPSVPGQWPVCCYCHQRKRKLTRDHVLPKSKGGPDDRWNIVMCCEQCNQSKADRTPSQWAADVIRYRGGLFARLRLLAAVAVLAFIGKGGAA